MVKKSASNGPKTGTPGAPFPDNIKDSAQQIWLAGLGAFTKAQQEGGKVFDALVKDGLAIQRKTQAVAEEKLTEATQKMSSMATDISAKATGQWDKLETIFEDRVAKALHKLGVPNSRDMAALAARIDELGKAVDKLKPPARASTPRAARSPAKPAAKSVAKPAAKRSPARKSS